MKKAACSIHLNENRKTTNEKKFLRKQKIASISRKTKTRDSREKRVRKEITKGTATGENSVWRLHIPPNNMNQLWCCCSLSHLESYFEIFTSIRAFHHFFLSAALFSVCDLLLVSILNLISMWSEKKTHSLSITEVKCERFKLVQFNPATCKQLAFDSIHVPTFKISEQWEQRAVPCWRKTWKLLRFSIRYGFVFTYCRYIKILMRKMKWKLFWKIETFYQCIRKSLGIASAQNDNFIRPKYSGWVWNIFHT